MVENVPAESGGGQETPVEQKSEINNSVLIANNNSDTSRSEEQRDREQTYLVYLKTEYEAMLKRDELKLKLENGDEEAAPLFDTPTPKARVLATISLARHHSTPWNITNKYTSCDDCEMVIPPRSYHCYYCDQCVLRLDHHCPWVGTCIGLLNFKFYWQFLLYGSLSLLIMTVTVLVLDGLTVLSVLSTVFLFDFVALLVIQTARVLDNKTATDADYLRGVYDIYREKSSLANWEQVFTPNAFSWVLPFGRPSIL